MRLYFLILCFVFSCGSLQSQSLEDTTAQLKNWYAEAAQLIENYQFKKALEPLSSYYYYGKYKPDILLKIAYCHQQLGRYRDAKIYYNEVLKRDSINIRALSAQANIATLEANHLKAQGYYDQLLQIDSTNSYYFKQAAYTALRRSDILLGIRHFLRAHALNPEDLEVIDQLSDIYLALDDVNSADQIVSKGLNLDLNNIKLLRNKARIHQKRKEHEKVVENILKIMAQGDTTDHYQTMLGVAYLKLDSLDQAIFHLERIVGREKADDRTFHYLGLAYFNKESYEKSKEYYALAIEAGVSQKIHIYHGDLGLLHEREKHLKPAIAAYKKSLEYYRHPEYLFHLAHASDRYYKDKKIAFKLYQEYMQTTHRKYKKFTEGRLEQLKEYLHFAGN